MTNKGIDVMPNNDKPLLPERREQLDFFVCDIFDAVPKDDLGSMEHPMFSLTTKPDCNVRNYEHNGHSITITPSVLGLATILDKDILIYCISQLVAAINKQQPISRTVRVTAYDLLKTTNRQTGGEGYARLEKAFERLAGTRIKTDIRTRGKRIREGFGLIEAWKIIEKSPTNERMVAVEITLSEWLYNAILGMEVLTIHRDYFRLRKPIERRLYEIARKHCGNQTKWSIGLALLQKKCDSRTTLKEFRRAIKDLEKYQHMPDYRLSYSTDKDQVTFYSQSKEGRRMQIEDMLNTVSAKVQA